MSRRQREPDRVVERLYHPLRVIVFHRANVSRSRGVSTRTVSLDLPSARLCRQNELINLAITQVVEFPPAVRIGTLADHHTRALAPRCAVWLISHGFTVLGNLEKALSHKPQTRSHRAVLGRGTFEELYQLLVEQSGHRRRPRLRKFAEECRR